jgi:hypothetical protein
MAAPAVLTNLGISKGKRDPATGGFFTADPISVGSSGTPKALLLAVSVRMPYNGLGDITSNMVIADSEGNSYTQAIGMWWSPAGTAVGEAASIWYCNDPNPITTGTVWGITSGMAGVPVLGSYVMRVLELDMEVAPVPFSERKQNLNFDTAPTEISGTPAGATDMLWVGLHTLLGPDTDTDTITSTGFTLLPAGTAVYGTAGDTAASNVTQKLGYKQVTASAAQQTFNGTLGVARSWNAVIIAFKSNPPPPSTPTAWYPSSPFNDTVASSSPADRADSDQIITSMFSRGNGLVSALTVGQEDSVKDFKHPIYFASGGDPQFTLSGGWDPTFTIAGAQWDNPDIAGDVIRIPAGAVPAGGSDSSMFVVQPDGTEYDLWDCQHTRPGGVQKFGFGTKGVFTGSGDDGLGVTVGTNRRGGITAAGFLGGLGVIRYAELASGNIPHAMFAAINGWHGRVWPSMLSGGGTGDIGAGHNAPPMGAWLQYDRPVSEINALAVPDWIKTILKCLQKYGAYIGDNGGSTLAFQFESGDDYTYNGGTNPWIQYAQAQGIYSEIDADTGFLTYYFGLDTPTLGPIIDWKNYLKVLDPSAIAPPPPDDFDPDTADPIDSGSGNGAATTDNIHVNLPDDDYRVYVKTAQNVGGTKYESDWAYSAFTIQTLRPSIPNLAADPNDTEARIEIDVTHGSGGDVNTTYIQIQRSTDDGDTWVDIRTLLGGGLVLAPDPLDYDYDVGNGELALYRARGVHQFVSGTLSHSDWQVTPDPVAWESDSAWIKHATEPGLNMAVGVISQPGNTRAARESAVRVMEREHPVFSGDVRDGPTGEITFDVPKGSLAEFNDLISGVGPFLIQMPRTWEWADRWVVFGDLDSQRPADRAWVPVNFKNLTWTEVDTPTANLLAWT